MEADAGVAVGRGPRLAEPVPGSVGPSSARRGIELAECRCGEAIWRGPGWTWEHVDTDDPACADAAPDPPAGPDPEPAGPGWRIEMYHAATTALGGALHVARDASWTALCGQGPVRFVGEPGQPHDEAWPWCGECAHLAPAVCTEVWGEPFSEAAGGWTAHRETRARRRERLRLAADPPPGATPVVPSGEPLDQEEHHGRSPTEPDAAR